MTITKECVKGEVVESRQKELTEAMFNISLAWSSSTSNASDPILAKCCEGYIAMCSAKSLFEQVDEKGIDAPITPATAKPIIKCLSTLDKAKQDHQVPTWLFGRLLGICSFEICLKLQFSILFIFYLKRTFVTIGK